MSSTTEKNPLISDTPKETLENAGEALEALIVLMATQHSGLCRLIDPIVSAIEHAREELSD